MDAVMPYVHEREQFGLPIGSFQLIQGKLADMYTTMNAAKAYVYAVAKACDRGDTTRKDAAGAILYAAEKATWMALEAIRSEEHTSELQSLMRISYAVFCLKKKKTHQETNYIHTIISQH